MVKKKVDQKVISLIESGIKNGHRSMFVIVGDHGKDQVENLHRILSKSRVKTRPSVLWCYKKELGFSTHKKKRMKEIKKSQARGLYDPDRDDPFDLFISSTNIRWTYYKETDKILGQTFGMVVLQDFEALTPNILARTIETVEGGGLVIILMRTVKSLKQLYTMTMDVHARFRTEACHEIVPRFNERFILSLGDCISCLVLDDELNILPLTGGSSTLSSSSSDDDDDAIAAYYRSVNDTNNSASEWSSSLHTSNPELLSLKSSLENTPIAGAVVNQSRTVDQAKAILSFLDAISEKQLRTTVVLTASRGRGKSAAIGLCLAGAISYGYSNIFVTAPSPENLITVFEFIVQGLKALKYTEHMDFEVIYESVSSVGKVAVRVNIFKEHRQTVQYIAPHESHKCGQAEIVAIDEAAAIPLPLVRQLMGPYMTFISSTINGYEGTGRALSLKLIQQLRQQQQVTTAQAAYAASAAVVGNSKMHKGERRIHEERWRVGAEAAHNALQGTGGGSGSGRGGAGRVLTELTLSTPIRYNSNDPIESWLNSVLCLDIITHSTRIVTSLPPPEDCQLYLVDREALFSYHALSEKFLQRVWALYTSAHYKNTPNDLQMLSDAPAHRLLVLLGPRKPQQQQQQPDSAGIPDILVVLQIAFEGRISQKTIQSEIAKGNKVSGDMIPWTIAQQYNDSAFGSLSGARVVRIATHPDVQGMGYGSRAIDLLIQYFSGDIQCVNGSLPVPKVGEFGGESGARSSSSSSSSGTEDNDDGTRKLVNEHLHTKSKLPPLLTALHERPHETLHWLGVGYGLTSQLFNFWSKKAFKLCYLRQTANDLTGEYSCIVLRDLISRAPASSSSSGRGWLDGYVQDYCKRLIQLMAYNFRDLSVSLALQLLDPYKLIAGGGSLTIAAADDADDHQASTTITSSTGHASSITKDDASASSSTSSSYITCKELLSAHFSLHDIRRLELYSRNMVDHHMIMDLVPVLARLLFQRRFDPSALHFSHVQVAVLLAVGLQHKDVDAVVRELELPSNQILAFFNKSIRKLTTYIRALIESSIEEENPALRKQNTGLTAAAAAAVTAANGGTAATTNNNSKNDHGNSNSKPAIMPLKEEHKQDMKKFYELQQQQKLPRQQGAGAGKRRLLLDDCDRDDNDDGDGDDVTGDKDAEEGEGTSSTPSHISIVSLPKNVGAAGYTNGDKKVKDKDHKHKHKHKKHHNH